MKICYFSSSRSDFGIVSNLLVKINKNQNNKLYLICTGSHLDKNFGSTKNEIDKYKLKNIHKFSFSFKSINDAISKSAIKIDRILDKIKPDILLLLGDRYETFAAAFVAYNRNIPIAHIHGGEVTLGSKDEQYRHAITKFSNLHFTSTDEYRKRVIQLGENPKFVFNFGSLSLENKNLFKLKSKNFFLKKYEIKFKKINFLITYHPNTENNFTYKKEIKILLDSLESFDDICLIFTSANKDYGGSYVNKKIQDFCSNKKNSYFIYSFGIEELFSLYKIINCVVGNSSSGIIEAPSFKIPTINIGNRQNGRVMSRSIINIDFKKENIIQSLKNVTKKINQKFSYKNPYQKKQTSSKILKVINDKKKFLDSQKFKFFHDTKK